MHSHWVLWLQQMNVGRTAPSIEPIFSVAPTGSADEEGMTVREKPGDLRPRGPDPCGRQAHAPGKPHPRRVTAVCAWGPDGSGSAVRVEREASEGVNGCKFQGRKLFDFPEPDDLM